MPFPVGLCPVTPRRSATNTQIGSVVPSHTVHSLLTRTWPLRHDWPLQWRSVHLRPLLPQRRAQWRLTAPGHLSTSGRWPGHSGGQWLVEPRVVTHVWSSLQRTFRHHNGLQSLARLTKQTMDNDIGEQVTAISWILSSCEDLKKPILDDLCPLMVKQIIVPHSLYQPNGSSATIDRRTNAYSSTVFRNASGVLR